MASKKNRKRKAKKNPQNEDDKTAPEQAKMDLENVKERARIRNPEGDERMRIHLILLGLPVYPTVDDYPLETLMAVSKLAQLTAGPGGFGNALSRVSLYRLERINARGFNHNKGLETKVEDIENVIKFLNGEAVRQRERWRGFSAPLRALRNRFVVLGFPEVKDLLDYDPELLKLLSDLSAVSYNNFIFVTIYVARSRWARLLDPARRHTGPATTIDDMRNAIKEAKENPVLGPDGKPYKPTPIADEDDPETVDLMEFLNTIRDNSTDEARKKDVEQQMERMRQENLRDTLLAHGPSSFQTLGLPPAAAQTFRSLMESKEFKDTTKKQKKNKP
ncbi:uncharacterized protein K452DRAFT_354915 [Aplosporella prunicola CBS 121167]|uniref:Uncharacterized protein n=1 Tax=Aplosporella prunicola CBS 121167 TaxID=1176127 RepID=A0A6A6BXC5_9PEZI|nr:uncharacterized protein K452DRAFT_354915 [Aplosporella prunicola CBS 121167]KAF2147557.1 hypothetical protein K452DRAFT_354915 [Aplosporella prunicola CBS 121167]